MLASVTCTRCKDIIEMPTQPETGSETRWCRCGMTYLQRTPTTYSYGGPGKPGEHEDKERTVAGFAREPEEKQ